MPLQLYGSLVAKINGELLREQHTINLFQALGVQDRIRIGSATPARGLEFNAHQRVGERIHVSVHLTTGAYDRDSGHLRVGDAVIAYDARIVAAELSGATNATSCSSFTCEAMPRPEEA